MSLWRKLDTKSKIYPLIMKEINLEINKKCEDSNNEVISFKCELHSNLQKAMNEFIDKHPNWDQYRMIQAAIAGFLMQKGFNDRNLTRLYVGNMFSMNFEN